jgi:hypothetical protein
MDHVAIVGPLERVRPRVAELARLGVTDCFVSAGGPPDPQKLRELMAGIRPADE